MTQINSPAYEHKRITWANKNEQSSSLCPMTAILSEVLQRLKARLRQVLLDQFEVLSAN
jgi:hypothetical protein